MESPRSNSEVPSGPPSGVSKEAWLRRLKGYVDSMRTSFPGASHPTDNWLKEGLKLYSSGQNLSAAGSSSTQLDIDSVRDQKLERLERTLEEHTKRNTTVELRARQYYLEQHEKNRQVRVGKFTQKAQQYHAGDSYDIETHALDLAEHARHLIPNLAPLVGQPVLNPAEFEMRVDSSKFYSEDKLAPLFGMI